MLINCPTGFSFKARPWNLGDRCEMLDDTILSQGLLQQTMADFACLEVVNPGPYQFTVGEKADWSKVSYADLTTANIQIRAYTKPTYDFDTRCERCKKIMPLSLDLREFVVYPPSTEGLECLATGTPVEKLVQNHKLKIKILRGGDSPLLAKHQKADPKRLAVIYNCMHIASILPAGETKELTTFSAIKDFWIKQSWEFGDEVDDIIEGLTGGADTEYEFRCKEISCGADNTGVLPLDLLFFGLDQRKKKGRQPNRSSELLSIGSLMSKT